MKRFALLASLSFAIACGSDSTGSGDDLQVSDVVGLWHLQIEANTSCSGAAGGGPLDVDLTGENRPAVSGSLNLTTAQWGFPSSGNIGFATGSVILSSGVTDIIIRKDADHGSEISGTIAADHSFTGVLRDPAPGLQANFVFGSCQFNLTGSRQ